MKQPELGKRIFELRKQKGFTQEELVEKCNINVRTIQRIEAGDVTPRSFTIKTILEALEVDNQSFFGTSVHDNETIQFSNDEKKVLNISWISGIFLIIFSIIGMIVETYLVSENGSFGGSVIPRISWNLPFLISLFFFLKGYHKIGKMTQNNTLVGGVYVYFALEFIITIILLTLAAYSFEEDIVEIMSGIVMLMLYGISELVLGIGVMKLKEYLGSFAQIIGILKIVNGIMLITIIFAPIGGFLVILVLIMEVILIYNTLHNSSDDGRVRSSKL